LQAIWDVSFEIFERELVTILGPNGAGKTTLLKTISGLIAQASGSVKFQNESLLGLPTHDIFRKGIVQIPEGRKIFPGMTVRENLDLGASLPNLRKNAAETLDEIFGLFPILEERQNQLAGTLSGGQQQQLAIGRGLMGQPKLLMLDEPTLGLSPKLATETIQITKLLNERGFTVLLVSQEVLQSLQIAQRAYVLETGSIVLSGSGEELLENMDIQKSYLGL
jgi:branched-chain amino acid transport system ATP-binding protein